MLLTSRKAAIYDVFGAVRFRKDHLSMATQLLWTLSTVWVPGPDVIECLDSI